MFVAALGAAAAFAALSSPPTQQRPPVNVVVLDSENLLVRGNQPIESVFIHDMYENTDYLVEHDRERNIVLIRLLTSRGPLRVVVETKIPGTRGLKRKHTTILPNPAANAWD